MLKIKDVLQFEKENFFDGAVQSDWFYDMVMRKKASESFIFHGPKYYGLNQADISNSKHRLIDTASFVKKIYDKIYTDADSSRFMLTIAGYGAGKSHLSVTLASLLSKVDINLSDDIVNKLKSVDSNIGNTIEEKSDKNLVIVLNGMNDFNLNNEILKNAKKSLRMYDLDESIFQDMTLAYKTAENFLITTFEVFEDSYKKHAQKYFKFKRLEPRELKNSLLSNVYDDQEAYEIINEVYKEITGNYIKWEEGISAATILTKLHNIYVKEQKIFKSVVVLFDEFGRYLEYAAAHPNLAGESAIQQIFEAVQNCKPSMMFIGFIQSDLSAYLSRVSNQNIARYVGRYENSDKYYLSSNLETVLANLIKKKNDNAEDIINNIFDNSMKLYSSTLFQNMNRWIPENATKSVWSDKNLFSQTIMKGCYPIHPMTVSLLSHLSTWMQQRSTLSFLGEIFHNYDEETLGPEGIPYIYPAKVIDSRIFNELLNAEEKGRQQGQQCTLFNDVLSKFGEKLSEDDKEVLRAILVLNISKYKVFDKLDNLSALMYSTGIEEKALISILDNLENKLGIIYLDEAINRYNFMAESNSKVDFNKEFTIKKLKTSRIGLFTTLDDEIKKEIGLDKLQETAFGYTNGITTGEWSFKKQFIEVTEFDTKFAVNLSNEFKQAVHPDTPKGNIVYLYCNKDNFDYIQNVENLIRSYNLEKVPFLAYLIYDDENTIKECLLDIRVLRTFDQEQRNKFKKYIDIKYNECLKKIVRKYLELAKSRKMITANGTEVSDYRLKDMCMNKFSEIYTSPVPFIFDGFEKKVTPAVRKRFNNTAIAIINKTVCSKNDFEALDPQIKNRIISVLHMNVANSWKVLLDNFMLTEPNSSNAKQIYDEILNTLKSSDLLSVNQLTDKYLSPPYGMNVYSLVLFFTYILTYNSKNIDIFNGTTKIKLDALVNFFNDDKKDIVQNVLKLRVRYKEQVSDNIIKDFIEEVNKNTRIENCEELLTKAIKISEEEEISEDLQGLFINLQSQLTIGVDACKKIYRDLDEATKEYNESFEKSFRPFNYIKINSYIGNIKEGRIPRTNYYYSIEYLERVNFIKDNSLNKITLNLYNYIDKIRVDNGNIDNIKRYTKQLTRILKSNNYVELADTIDKKIDSIEKGLRERSKYEAILQKCNLELDICKRYIKEKRDLNKAETIINEWDNYFTSNNINENIKSTYNEKLSILMKSLEERFEEVKKFIEIVISKANLISSLTETKNYKRELEELLDKGIPDQYKNTIKNICNMVDDVIEEIIILQSTQTSRKELEQTIKNLKEEYEGTILQDVIEKVGNAKVEAEIKKESSWREKYIKEVNDINNMTSSQLLKFKSETEFKPYYLTEETLEEYNVLLKVVNNKLAQYKIENIIQIFEELDEKQKQECLNKLKELNILS